MIGLLTFRGDTVGGQEVSGFSFIVPSNTVMEYVKSAGATNTEGPTDTLFREGLGYYWDQYYSSAIPKFEEVKRMFPQHSEVDRLIQSSQQAKSEGKERSSFPVWIIVAVVVVLLLILLLIIIIVAAILIARKRRKGKAAGPPSATPAAPDGKGRYAPPPPTPAPAPTPVVAQHRPPSPPPHVAAADQGRTVDLSRTVALTADEDAFPPNYGSIHFTSGPLSGQQFQIKSEGEFIGRDGGSSQIVLGDPRISKRHVWIGVRNGRVVIEDQNSRNGTFVNDPKSARVTETSLNSGDVVILGESDVARFEYRQ